MESLIFGPVPSRRLGRSLGINNIPAKTCSYSCVYCQLGKTTNMTTRRQAFHEPEEIYKEVKNKLDKVVSRRERVDYLTFVPDGEPTLDISLGKTISLLKRIGIPIAVLTNASLLWHDEVRENLLEADFVSVKIDVVSQDLWKSINRPHKSLRLNAILEGIKEFAKMFKGKIVSETMLIDDVKYNSEFEKIAEFLGELHKLDKAYIAIPTRPPAEKWVKPAKEEVINHAFQVFSEELGVNRVEYLIGYEGNAFAFTGKVEEDLLSITAVHPMRKEAVTEFLKKANADWEVVEKLLKESRLIELGYEGKKYYMRKLPSRRKIDNTF
ncbi:MAG TPA: radical SAM protein [Candidatus Bathyarchaeota archaeon]|nr:radical SAM protein [Candidatus Bathyarchaeota archaeon]HEX68954.1 radical SAM protein [Candidatus Bathyarchaeota archaeon]